MAVLDKFFGKIILYFPGCTTRYKLLKIKKNYEAILTDIGINFITLDDVSCAGLPALEAGYQDVFNELIERNKEVFKANKIKKIVTNSPEAYYTFKKYYRNLEVEHITQLIWKHITAFDKRIHEEMTYLDSCYLGRYTGIYDEPRNILKRLGINVVEVYKNREHAFCSGSEAVFKDNNPTLAKQMAIRLLSKIKTNKAVTCNPNSYLHLKNNKIDIIELSEVLI